MSSVISSDEIATKEGLLPEKLDDPFDESSVVILATFVHPWRLFFADVLPELDITDVEAENSGRTEQEKRVACLRKWKTRFGADATCRVLVESALRCGNVSNAEAICRHLAQAQSARRIPLQPTKNEQEVATARKADITSDDLDVVESAKKKLDGTEIKSLEEQFLNIQKRFLAELARDKSVNADTLLGTLCILPVELQVEYGKFLDDKLPALEQHETVLIIFRQLSRHFTFLDYGLLGHLIKEHGSEKLQQDMTAYVASMQIFLDETLVQQLIDFWPGQLVTPPHFEELKAVVYQNPRVYSMRQLDDLRKNLCSETHLSEMVLVLKRVGRSNSFTVSWLVPSTLASQLMVTLTQVSDTFYEKEFIYSISVNQHLLYCSVAMREKKFECERRLIVLCVENIGDISEFSHLLSQPGVDTDIRDQDGRTLLWSVCYDGRTDIAEVLITYGADVDLVNEDEIRESPLFAASGEGHITTCSLLLEKGATVDKRNKDGSTPLTIAAQEGHMEIASRPWQIMLA